jgi:hypothetical protein
MNTIKKLFFSVLISGLILSTPTFAQTPPASQVVAPVAMVNIQNAKINDQVGNVFDLSFVISNGDGVQGDVRYSVRLMAKTAKGYTTVDEKDYDEVLSLGENKSVSKQILYTAPAMLTGSYALFVVSANSKGFPFGTVSLGEVKLTASKKGVELVQDSCVTDSDFLGAFGVKCTAINHIDGNVSVVPVVQTHAQSVYGTLVKNTAVAPTVSFKAGEKKIVSFPVSKAQFPGLYFMTVALSYNNDQSNAQVVPYPVEGAYAKIANISPDADYYKSGDKAAILLLWSGAQAVVSDARITSSSGILCGDASIANTTRGKETIVVPITKDCMNPHIMVVLKDSNGVVFDQKTIDVQTTSQPSSMIGGSKAGALIGIILIALAAAFVLIRRRRHPVPTILPIIVLGISLSLLGFSSAHANSYPLGGIGPTGDIWVTVNVDGGSSATPTVFPDATGTIMTVYGSIVSAATTNYTVDMSAVTVGNTSVSLFTDPVLLAPGSSAVSSQETLNVPRCDVAHPCPRPEVVTFNTIINATSGGGGSGGNSCTAYVRFVGSFRYGGVLWLGPSTHPAVNVTVALEGSYSNTVNPDGPAYVNFVIPANASQSYMGEFYGVGGFDHGWVDHTDLSWACGDATQNYSTCFVADTQVDMADGTKKNIQDVQIGDVLKGETSNNTVLGFHRPNLDGKVYSFNGGRYFVTEEHPFKTIDGWKSINPKKTATENIGITVTDLKVGDTLVTDHGLVKLTSIEGKAESKDTQLYNFKLTGDRTYYADGYLVHNKNACDEVTSCGNNRACIETNVGYRIVPPPGGTCPVGCRFPDGSTAAFCINSQYSSWYCPNPITRSCN